MRNQSGSITVEASVIVTVALGLTFFVFFMACYLCDIHRLQAAATESAWLALQRTEQTQDISSGRIDWTQWGEQSLLGAWTADFSQEEQLLEQYVQETAGKKLWFQNTCQVDVKVQLNQVEVIYEGIYHFPVRLWFGEEGGIPFYGEVSLSGVREKEWIRAIGGIVRGFGGEE